MLQAIKTIRSEIPIKPIYISSWRPGICILFSEAKHHRASNENIGLKAIASNIECKKFALNVRLHFGRDSEGGSSF
jgi:hypothetical protein